MVIVASIQSSGSHPGQWDQLFFWEAVHVGLLILQMNYRKKERKRKKEASLMDRYWWKNLFCPGIIRRLFVRRGCVFIVTDAHPGGWDRGICIVLLCEIASVIFYTNSWSVWGVKHGEGLNFVVLVLSDRFFLKKLVLLSQWIQCVAGRTQTQRFHEDELKEIHIVSFLNEEVQACFLLGLGYFL